MVILVNASMLFYIFLFALQQSKTRQNAWLQSFLIWFLTEVVFVSTIVVLIVHYLVPTYIHKDVAKIKERLMQAIQDYHHKLESENVTESSSSSTKSDNPRDFNAADFLFVSTRIAKQLPDLPVAQIIASFSTPWPRQSYQHTADESTTYRSSLSFLYSSFGAVLFFLLSGFVSIPPGMQDAIVHSSSAAVVGYTVLLHVQLYNVFPALAFLPVFCLSIAGHFALQAHRSHAPKDKKKSHMLITAQVMPIEEDFTTDTTNTARKVSSLRVAEDTSINVYGEFDEDESMGYSKLSSESDEIDSNMLELYSVSVSDMGDLDFEKDVD
mmetsp:Transcript_23979/g.32852  ORF Transcript_23979/g.32852 Transcript_23979/m.32852 type:complete len:325 (+) Transcript_23979:739-1713(+)